MSTSISATIGRLQNLIWCIMYFVKCTVYSLLGLLQNQILSNLLVKEQCFGHTSQKALNSEIFHVERKDPSKLNFGVPSSLSYV